MRLEELIKANSAIVENELDGYTNISDGYGLTEIMRYSLLSGGKRIRPFIAIESYRLFAKDGADIKKVLPFACALEMIHTYSLIHDDMPCMDNDDYRRGRLTSHKVYGEAKALLAGDALLTYAFDVAASNTLVSPKSVVLAVRALSEYAGFSGMAGGQMIDLDSAHNVNSYESLKEMHSLKTGALIKCAALLGYYASTDEPDKSVEKALETFANDVGIAFQIRDDILDRIADTGVLGKPVGSDDKNGKTTSLSYLTVEEAQKEVDKFTGEAISVMTKLYETYSASEDRTLADFAKYLAERNK